MASKGSTASREQAAADIYVGRALSSEFPVILNNMPQGWFPPEPHLLHLQVAKLINANQFMIAQLGSRLLGGVGWQEDIAFGAYYLKFLFVKPEYQHRAVAVRLIREVIAIAAYSGQRAIFGDIPEDSPLKEIVDEIPGARMVGYIDDFHAIGVRSLIVAFDMREHDRLLRHADRLIARAGNNSEG
jgi:hypothetical protein